MREQTPTSEWASAPSTGRRRLGLLNRASMLACAHLGVLGLAFAVYSVLRASRILGWAFGSAPEPQRPAILRHIIDVLLFPIGASSPSLIAEARVVPMAVGLGLIVLNSLRWGACLALVWQMSLARRGEA